MYLFTLLYFQDEAAELEEILAKRQKKGKQVDERPLEEKTVLHSKSYLLFIFMMILIVFLFLLFIFVLSFFYSQRPIRLPRSFFYASSTRCWCEFEIRSSSRQMLLA